MSWHIRKQLSLTWLKTRIFLFPDNRLFRDDEESFSFYALNLCPERWGIPERIEETKKVIERTKRFKLSFSIDLKKNGQKEGIFRIFSFCIFDNFYSLVMLNYPRLNTENDIPHSQLPQQCFSGTLINKIWHHNVFVQNLSKHFLARNWKKVKETGRTWKKSNDLSFI